MIILQILLAIFSFGVGGFILYGLGLALHAGPQVTKQQVNKDPRFQ